MCWFICLLEFTVAHAHSKGIWYMAVFKIGIPRGYVIISKDGSVSFDSSHSEKHNASTLNAIAAVLCWNMIAWD